jgi:hypothetical protein
VTDILIEIVVFRVLEKGYDRDSLAEMVLAEMVLAEMVLAEMAWQRWSGRDGLAEMFWQR